jgi:hypothetical protein
MRQTVDEIEYVRRDEFLKLVRIVEDIAENVKILSDEQIRIREEQVKMREEQIKMREEQVKLRLDIEDAIDFMYVTVGGFQRRVGRKLEDTIAGVMRFGLGLKDIKPESLKLRQKIKVGKKKYEIDLLSHNDKYYIFEISSYADSDKLDKFLERVDAAISQLRLSKRKVKKVLISLDRSEDILDLCKEYNVILIP